MHQRAQPVSEKKRLYWIDAARGFAVFGIFIVNIGAFSAPYFRYGGEDIYWQSPVDQVTLAIIDIFFQASFYTLFSILFGFGIQLMNESFARKSLQPHIYLLRRLGALIGFGMIHAFVIWHGDILLSYGVIGLLLLLFLKRTDQTWIAWIVILFGGSTVFFTFLLYLVRDYLNIPNTNAIESALERYQSSNLFVIWEQNYTDWLANNGVFGFLILSITLLPLFLIGMYIARKRWLHEPHRFQPFLQKLWLLLLIVFISFKAGPYLFGNPAWFGIVQDNIGGAASALFYIVSIALVAQQAIGQKLLAPLVAVGRMAFTNYILQSVISFILFYGAGFGWYGTIRPLEGVLIAAVLFIVQVALSNWWLRRYLYGPLEWVWRSFTYGEKQPFKRKGKQPVGYK